MVARLEALRGRVAELVERRSADDPTAADPLRGMYVTPETAFRLATTPLPAAGGMAAVAGAADGGVEGGAGDAGSDPLDEVAREFGLSVLDQHILLAALAPDVDRRFEPLYGYLNDDVGRRRATVTLALDLSGTGPHDPLARRRFHPRSPLRAGGLIVVEEEDRPLPGRALRVPERVVAQLLGDDALDPELVDHDVELLAAEDDGGAAGIGATAGIGDAADTGATADAGSAHPLALRVAALAAERPLRVHLRERREGTAAEPVAEALRAAGRTVLRYRPSGTASDAAAVALVREARLRRAALVVGPLPDGPGPLVRSLVTSDVPVVFFGSEPYDPGWAPDAGLLVLDAPQDAVDAARTWHTELARYSPAYETDVEPDFDLGEAVAPYRLSGTQIRRAARDAAELAAFDGTAPTVAHLQRSARLQSAPLLDKHARRIRPEVGFADLVLPDEPLAMLNELTLRARHRDKVLGEWRLRTGGGRGRGVIALFAGDSGTGKTLSAEVVAGELGLDLYVVDLSAVVDKYIGETEKNLERIFVEADRTDAVLLFDEADAVFGKRSEVKSSHDRYANLESAYLLQRLEAFDGIAVLTTNLRANIDDAFTRRLDLVVDFPFPDVEQRLALWRTCLTGTPCADDLDEELAACAKEFELSGGAIRSAAVTAAYQAAGHGGPVSGADVRAGARREYRKMGRLEPGTSLPWQR
ncbi:ATP-binding protein [Streptomyces sp. NPDC020607]|uniref:ATP-binding protein n=1 Tax=Streptomyces sp. NPDC020607 TaxID=3365082 RepID=UPI0037B25B81